MQQVWQGNTDLVRVSAIYTVCHIHSQRGSQYIYKQDIKSPKQPNCTTRSHCIQKETLYLENTANSYCKVFNSPKSSQSAFQVYLEGQLQYTTICFSEHLAEFIILVLLLNPTQTLFFLLHYYPSIKQLVFCQSVSTVPMSQCYFNLCLYI